MEENQLKEHTPIREDTGAETSKNLDIVPYVETPPPLAMMVLPPCNLIITMLPQDPIAIQSFQESVVASAS